MVHQGEENAPCSATATFLLTPQYWTGKFLFVSKLSRSDLEALKGADLASVISWCLQWQWDGKKYLLSLGSYCNYLVAEAEVFTSVTLRDGKVADFYQLFSLGRMCFFMNEETFWTLTTNPPQHFQPVIHHIIKKQYEVISPMVRTDSVAFRFCGI